MTATLGKLRGLDLRVQAFLMIYKGNGKLI